MFLHKSVATVRIWIDRRKMGVTKPHLSSYSTTALWNSRLGLNNQQPSSVYAESPRISADHAGATGGGAGGGGRMRRPYSVAAIEPVHLAEEFTG